MSNLKELRNRVENIKNMKRITSAMKLVAAAKLRHAQDQRIWARSYADHMEVIYAILEDHPEYSDSPFLKEESETDKTLFVVISSDKGLCGGFNANLMRDVRGDIEAAKRNSEEIFLISAGKKISTLLRRYYHSSVIESYDEIGQPFPEYAFAKKLADHVLYQIARGKAKKCFLIYNRFVSNLIQEVTRCPLVPVVTYEKFASGGRSIPEEPKRNEILEPEYQSILEWQIKKIVSTRIYSALLESFQAEQAARINAMDNASRNATDLISELTLAYNRLRQAAITKELVEIISGAEAV